MVGNRDRVDYGIDDVKDVLVSLRDRKKEEAVMGVRDEEAAFLEHCLKHLEDYERDILLKTYSDGVSIRRYSLLTGFSRNFIARQREKSLALLTKFFNIKYRS